MRRLSDIAYNHDPLVLAQTATVKTACQKMKERRVGSTLVVDQGGALVGIFTARDAVQRVLAVGKSAARTALQQVMTANPTTMTPDQTAIEALRIMWDGGFRHIPVVRRGKLLGVVSRGDFKGDERNRLDEERELWEHMR
jgi:CBS domain-containing protein